MIFRVVGDFLGDKPAFYPKPDRDTNVSFVWGIHHGVDSGVLVALGVDTGVRVGLRVGV